DALNRLQFEQLTNKDILDADAELKIHITTDEDAGTLTISDTGIGMTREDIIENLGTIARSGAKNFIEAIKDVPDNQTAADIIGQFGVGFYSVFMVADTVEVISRSHQPDADAVAWEADGGTAYTLDVVDKATRGTDIVIHLKDHAKDFLQSWKIKEVIRRHSDYVAFPIFVDEDEDPTNSQQALWRRSPREVEDDEYANFYRMLTLDFNPALHQIHMRADVPMQFYALLFIPGSSEPNMLSPRKDPGLKLYARKVLIDEYNTDLLPDYLQFVQGVVDSEDLPLNVSRESVKADRIMARLKGTLKNKVLSDLKKMANKDRDDYLKIHAQFGRFLKQGIVADPTDREDLQELVFFNSSTEDTPDVFVSLNDYTDRMVDGQDDIYYIVANDFASAQRSPHLDAFRQRGIEVLYFSDPVDAILPMGLNDYKGHTLRSVDEGDIDLTDVGTLSEDDAAQTDALESDSFNNLTDRVKAVLGARVSGVRESKTLVGSPARLVSEEGGGNRHMFRINYMLDKDYEMPVMTLELNSRHPLVHNLAQMSDGALANAVIEQIFETALLQEGIHPDPASMAERLTMLMQAATGSAVNSLDWEKVAPEVQDVVLEDAPDAPTEDIVLDADVVPDDNDMDEEA
ncbi:MAG: molecular chaperone HtpG, partial [Aggregatilineales bacterium]